MLKMDWLRELRVEATQCEDVSDHAFKFNYKFIIWAAEENDQTHEH